VAKKAKKAKTAKKAKKAPKAKEARARFEAAAARPAAAAALQPITFSFEFGGAPPTDLMFGAQIDDQQLTFTGTTAGARISPGSHTTSWAVVSAIVRPLPFGVKIVSAGATLLSRPAETTGADGMGVGADRFQS
jgi:hypothetical protein